MLIATDVAGARHRHRRRHARHQLPVPRGRRHLRAPHRPHRPRRPRGRRDHARRLGRGAALEADQRHARPRTCPEPVETYSTSEHLFADLGIPEGSTGRLPLAKRTRAGPRRPSRRRTWAARSGARGRGRRRRGAAPRARPSGHGTSRPRAESEGEAGEPAAARRRRTQGRRGRAAAEPRERDPSATSPASRSDRPARQRSAPAAQPRWRRRPARDAERERNSAFGRLTLRDPPDRRRGRARRGRGARPPEPVERSRFTASGTSSSPRSSWWPRWSAGCSCGSPATSARRVADLRAARRPRRRGRRSSRRRSAEAWRAKSPATPEPVTVGPAVVTGDGRRGRRPRPAHRRGPLALHAATCRCARWPRRGRWRSPCTQKSDNLLRDDDPRKAGGCSEVTALDPATGQARQARQARRGAGQARRRAAQLRRRARHPAAVRRHLRHHHRQTGC